MCGFFDRVFTPEFAYKFENKKLKKLLKGKKAVVIETYNSPEFVVRLIQNDLCIKTLKSALSFCGIKLIKRMSFFSVTDSKPEARKKWLEKVKTFASNSTASSEKKRQRQIEKQKKGPLFSISFKSKS